MTVKGIKIQKRDIVAFKALQKFGFLSIPMIGKLCFPNTTIPSVARRMKKLTDYKLVKRAIPRGSSQYFYYITEKVREYLENGNPIKRLKANQLVHDSRLAEVMFHLYFGYPQDQIFSETDLGFLSSSRFRTVKKHNGKMYNLDLNFIPDGAIHYRQKGLYFIEYDRSTMWGLKLHCKLFSYDEYYRSGSFKRDFGNHLEHFRVIMLCKGIERIQGIMKTYREEPVLSLFVFTTHREFFALDQPLHASIWKHMEKDELFPLISKI